jgi:hypothetical protein
MNFEPFDTGLIAQRLREQVAGLHSVGGAADYAAVKELAGFRTPSGYVIFAEERNTGKVPAAPCVTLQESVAQFGVVLALRHYKELRGEQMQPEARRLIGACRAALIGHKPPAPGSRVVSWLSGKVLDYDGGVLLYADLYELPYLLRKD